MNKSINFFIRAKSLTTLIFITLLSACSPRECIVSTKSIAIDGSSTVYPITNLVVEKFNDSLRESTDSKSSDKESTEEIEVKVEFSGSLSGFEKFCRGETDINNASVPIPQQFMAECKKNGVPYIELPIAFDAITVVVNKNNNWLNTITVQELRNMWQASGEGNITHWNQINNQWPNVQLNLFAPDQNSGTHEYFNLAILGEGQASRSDYVSSENDQILVDAVNQDPNAIAYFGYAYYQQNQDKLKALNIDSGNDGVFPMDETIKNNSYLPLTRPLFIYVNAQKAQQNKRLTEFVNFYLNHAEMIVEQVGYLPLPTSGYKSALIHFQGNYVGTVFNGSPILNASITELINKTYASENEEGYVY